MFGVWKTIYRSAWCRSTFTNICSLSNVVLLNVVGCLVHACSIFHLCPRNACWWRNWASWTSNSKLTRTTMPGGGLTHDQSFLEIRETNRSFILIHGFRNSWSHSGNLEENVAFSCACQSRSVWPALMWGKHHKHKVHGSTRWKYISSYFSETFSSI